MKYIKAFFLGFISLSLMFMVSMICLLSHIPRFLNNQTYHDVLEQVDAYARVHETIENSLEDMMLVNNIDRHTLSNLITLDEVKEIMTQDINAMLSWLTESGPALEVLDLTTYETRFDEKIDTFFRNNHYELDDADKQEIQLMKQTAMRIIQGNLRVLEFDQLTNTAPWTILPKLMKFLDIKVFIAGLMGGVLLLMAILLILSRKKLVEGLLWSGYGILAGGLLIFILFFSGLQSGFYHHTAIQVIYLRQSIGLLIETTFKSLVICGLIASGIGVLFMIPYWHRLYKKCLAR